MYINIPTIQQLFIPRQLTKYMVINIKEFLSSSLLIIIVSLIVLIIFVVFLTIIQKRLKRKIGVREEVVNKQNTLKDQLESLKVAISNPQKKVKQIDKFANKLIKEHFQLPKHLDYSEMSSLFKKMHKPHISLFCDQMIQALYSGEDITQTQINVLVRNLEKVITLENLQPLISEKDIKTIRKIKGKTLPKKIEQPKLKIQPQTMPVIAPPLNIHRKLIQIKPHTAAPQIKTIKKLPIKPVEIYTVKKEVTKDLPKKRLTVSSPEFTESEPQSHQNIESIDNTERIESQIDLRKRLRKEAQV